MRRTSFSAHEIEIVLRAWLHYVWMINLEPVSIVMKCLLSVYSMLGTVLGFGKMDKRNKTHYIPISWSL